MQLGIFAKTFVLSKVEEIFDAVAAHGLDSVQFNFSCAGLSTVPSAVPRNLARQIQTELKKRSLTMAAVSGTCNLIHPNRAERTGNLRNLEVLLHECGELGTKVVTLCTGTRDASDMWRAHPENHSAAAWQDLTHSLEQLLPTAEQCHVVLGVEPEPANVIDTAIRARQLLDEMRSPWLKVVFDGANLLRADSLDSQDRTLKEGIELLGKDIILAHAKDLVPGPPPQTVAPGRGQLHYEWYLRLLEQARFVGPLILHGLQESEVVKSVAFLKQFLEPAHEP